VADTLILQLGYILHTVPSWKKDFRLRVLVFVEYESELRETRDRVQALLEKLRIPAEVHAFWLASGELATYAAIINGHSEDASAEQMVDDVLKDEDWWTRLKRLRGKGPPMTASQEWTSLDQAVEPPAGQQSHRNLHDDQWGRRRPSMAIHGQLPKKPTVSSLSRLGVSVGIHTHTLPHKIFQLDSDNEDGPGSHDSSDDSEPDPYADDTDSAASEGDLDGYRTAESPTVADRRKSHGDSLTTRPALRRKRGDGERLLPQNASNRPSYGTLSASTTLGPSQSSQGKTQRSTVTTQSSSPVLQQRKARTPDSPSPWPSTTNLQRPGLLRTTSSAVRFSSSLVPETRITEPEGEGSGPILMFSDAEVPTLARTERPAISRSQSAGHLPDQAVDGKRAVDAEGLPTLGPSNAESAGGNHQPRAPDRGSNSLHVEIPETAAWEATHAPGDSESGSSYATQDLALSFNNLPSRAQHLILNELMRQNSSDTVVLLTTLPIPEEGTCESEEASVRYLSDIEVLCHDLPPTLLVLSNTMTVTVSL